MIPQVKRKTNTGPTDRDASRDRLRKKIGLLALGGRHKSPGVAAVLGFVPALGALYVRKYRLALVLGLAEVPVASLSVLSVGLPRIMYGLIGVFLSHKWAVQSNIASMEGLVSSEPKGDHDQ